MQIHNKITKAIKPELNRFEKHLRFTVSQNGVARHLFAHQNRLRGKRLRPCLLFLCAKATGQIKSVHFDLATVIELIHNATLIHDDVLDEAKLRRACPSFNSLWGNETSILFGDILFSHAFLTCSRIKSQQAVQILSQTTNQMCYGELVHTGKKFDLSLTEKEYLKIIEHKTASLFSTACYLGALLTTSNRKLSSALADYGLNFGMAYQIMDDYFDLVSNEKTTGKTMGSDLTKGKITLPLIYVLRFLSVAKQKDLKRQIRRLANQTNSSDGFVRKRKQIVRILNKYDALDYALLRARKYVQQARVALQALPNSHHKELLHTFADAIVL